MDCVKYYHQGYNILHVSEVSHNSKKYDMLNWNIYIFEVYIWYADIMVCEYSIF